MGQTAESKFDQADRLHKRATSIKKSDPESAAALENLARKKRKAGIRQMNRRPKGRRGSRVVV